MRTAKGAALLATALVAGCYEGVRADDPGWGASDGASGPSGGGSDGDDAGDSDGEPGEDPEAACDGEITLGHTPLRRLTRFEYDNVVRDLLGDDSAPARAFTPDETIGGFDVNTLAPLTDKQLDEYFEAAEDLAESFVATQLDAWVACDPVDDACLEAFVRDFGKRAFRRPLDDTEVADYAALFDDASTEWGTDVGFESVVHAMLTSPYFLYHFEPPAEDGPVALDPFQLAARLSFFVWGSLPDDALFEAAETGGLADRDGIEAQVRRMLEDPRAGDAIASFHVQWMGLSGLPDLVRDAELYPSWNPALGQSMAREVAELSRWAILEGDGTLATLLTTPTGFVDEALADLYGVEAPATPFERVDLPADERAGLLTTAAFLTATSHADAPSVTFRGKFVREHLLCDEIQPPPCGVIDDNPGAIPLEDQPCKSCHLFMDPIGHGFAQYDSLGAFDGDAAASGTVEFKPEIGEFDGVVELAHQLAAFDGVAECMVHEWYRYATRRMPEDADECQVEALGEAFVASGGNVRELIVAIATSTAFRHRAPESQ